jgi:exosortase/archaeosortase
MNNKELSGLIFRYLIVVLIGLFGISLLYAIFTPLVVYPSFWILRLFFTGITLQQSTFVLGSSSINIIPACIAGAAYYLLLILNLSSPMPKKTRANSLIFLLSALSALNILRLVVFSSLFFSGFSYFDIAHKAVWYFGSTILVVGLWFVNVRLFNIKSIPAYTDLTNLRRIARKSKR